MELLTSIKEDSSGIVFYILVIGLYAYLVYSRWGKPSPFTARFNSDSQNTDKKETESEDGTDEQTEETVEQKGNQGTSHPIWNRPVVRHVRTHGGPESTVYTLMWC